MNWTEGNLARHFRNRKHNEGYLRQKEHFVKVRSGLLNSNVNTSPPSISLLAQARYSVARTSSHAPQTIPSNSSRKRPQEPVPLEKSQYFANFNVELPNLASFQKEQAEPEALRRKRQKLLTKNDWAGTDLQKPIQLEFSKPRTSHINPWGSSRTSLHSSKQRFRHLLGLNVNNSHAAIADQVTKNPTPVSRGQLKVRVGTREKVLGGSSSISPRSRSYHDIEASSNGRRHQTRRQSRNSEKRAKQHKGPGQGSDPQAHRSNSGSNHPGVPTTSPLLYHPVPCRPTLPQLLRSQSNESDTSASNLAQVGMMKAEMSFSGRHENGAWRVFVTGPPRRLSSDDLPSQDGSLPEPLISPGVSQHRRLGRHSSLEARQSTGGSQLTVMTEDNSGIGTSTVQCLSDVSSPSRVYSRPPMEGTRGKNSSLVSSCADLQTSNQMPLESSLGASPWQDVSPALKECSPQSTNPNESLSDRSVTSAEDQAREPTREPTQQIDGLSTMAMPSSADASSDDLFKLFCNPSPICGKQASTEERSEEHQLQQQGQQHEQGVAEMEKQTADCSASDENDLWRKFVFGESSDGLEKALEDARQQTARSIRPSKTPTSSGGRSVGIHHEGDSQVIDRSSALSGEEFHVDFTRIADDFDDSSTGTTTAVSASHLATTGNSLPDPLTEDIVQLSDTLAQTDRATYGSTSSTDLVDEFLQRSDVWSSITKTRDRTLNAVHAQPAQQSCRPEPNFKFVPPKPFLGRKASHIDEQRHISLSIPQVRGKNPTSRRQRRQCKDGRTTIRTLPDFNDDPIEEFEGDILSSKMQEQSLFGSLEVENGL